MSSSKIEVSKVVATEVKVTDDTLVVDLSNGRTISVPLPWYPRLVNATPKERSCWRLIGGGWGIHWLILDEDISVDNLIAGHSSGESRHSLQQWLAKRSARKGKPRRSGS
jgi:hypothetical protein